MKKGLGLLAVGGFFFMLLLLVCTGGSDSGGSAFVAMPFADEDEAYAYQYIGSELGIPWDIVLLVDGIHAYAAAESDMKNYNPMLTSLQFCILMEEEFEAVTSAEKTEGEGAVESEEEAEESDEPENGAATPEEGSEQESIAPSGETTETSGEGETQEGEEEPEISWVSKGIRYYTGLEEILAYLDIGEESAKLTYKDAAGIVTDLTQRAGDKSTEEVRYEVTLLTNLDYEAVLRELIGLSEQYIEYALELYDSNYLETLYGYDFQYTDIELPEIVQGNVTREDLARVAVSLINHPYLMGGKSTQAGPPTGPLDCSGFVDWVYMQCFGTAVGSGQLPEGVAVSGTAIQWYACEAISASELKVGDLGFVRDPATIKNGQVNHVGIYLGTYEGKAYWIHCGGSAYKTDFAPKGRVGISVASGKNNYNPVDGTTFEPAMNACRFKYFRRPRFEFAE